MTDYKQQVNEFQPVAQDPIQAGTPAAPTIQPVAQDPIQAGTPAAPTIQPIAPEPLVDSASQPGLQAAETQPNAYDSIIQQQTEQINALITQNQSLTNQIAQLVQGGAQVGNIQQAQQSSPMQEFNPPSLQNNDDWSLEALGRKMAGKE